MQLDDHVCLCFHVSKRKILNFIRIHQPKVVSQVAECGGAGTGCGWCRSMIARYFTEATNGAAGDDPTPEEYARSRAKYIRAGGGTPPPGATPIDDETE